ncbi:MAG TPA: hypothetical protein VGY56_06330, partial [Verrucomicrobiae bacterium]|nr:hypothetical protein [Verrucomicrobiae bacterium]
MTNARFASFHGLPVAPLPFDDARSTPQIRALVTSLHLHCRLPWDILPRLRCAAAAQAQRARQLWRGLCVKIIDGTSASLPDTPKN